MKKILLNMLITLLLFIALLTGSFVFIYSYQTRHEKGALEALKSQVFVEREGMSDSHNGQIIKKKSDEVVDSIKTLQLENDDLKAWIQIPDTHINYPVMQSSESPEFYLHNDFNKKYSLSGLPFIQANCSLSPQSDNVILYGHNMKDNETLFSQLLLYENKDFWLEHSILYFYTQSEKQTFEIMAAMEVEVNSKNSLNYADFVDASNSIEFDEFLSEVKRISFYETGVEAMYGNKLLTLSTCSNKGVNRRFVVIAKQIEDKLP